MAPQVDRQLILLGVEAEPIVREVIGFGELLDSDAKIPERLLGPALLIQEFQSNRPRRLGAAVLTAKFVEPPLDATIKPEVVSMECENLHIPADLVVTRRFSHHTLALAMGYPHHVSSAPTAICMEMRHGPDRQSDTQKPHDHR